MLHSPTPPNDLSDADTPTASSDIVTSSHQAPFSVACNALDVTRARGP